MKLLFQTLFLALICASNHANAAETKNLKIDKLMAYSHQNGLFNGSVLVAENGKVIYSKAFGVADKKRKQNLTTDSKFYLASVSKQFTSMAIMLLKEKGKLSFDDKLSDFFNDFPEYSKRITIEHLLTHTSGIPDYFRLGIYKSDLKNQDVLEELMQQEDLDFEPGEKYAYSNGGYVLLALIVEKVSEQPFHQYLKEHIFKPLGMNDTLVYDESKPEVVNRAVGYNDSGTLNDYNILTVGDGGMYSTVRDLFKWDRALYTEQLISTATLKKAFTSFKLNNGELSHYGYGWSLYTDKSGENVAHGGSLAGFRTIIERQLEQQNAIIMLTNFGDAFAQGEIKAALNNILKNNPYTLPKLEVAVSNEILSGYIGEYESKTHPLKIEIVRDEGKLFGKATGQNYFRLKARTNTTFDFLNAGIEIEFNQAENSFVIKQGGRTDTFVKNKSLFQSFKNLFRQ